MVIDIKDPVSIVSDNLAAGYQQKNRIKPEKKWGKKIKYINFMKIYYV